MKKIFAAFAAGLVAFALGGCAAPNVSTSVTATTPAATAAAILANLKTVVVNGCSVVQPTLQSISTIDGSVTAAATANGLFCTAASSITVTSAQTLLDTGIPAVISAVNASTFIDPAQKPIIVAALSLFGLTVKNAIAAYNTAIASMVSTTAAPASAPGAASAPVAASQ
jgi:hypothetical protein